MFIFSALERFERACPRRNGKISDLLLEQGIPSSIIPDSVINAKSYLFPIHRYARHLKAFNKKTRNMKQ